MTTTAENYAAIRDNDNYRETVLEFLNTRAYSGATVTEVKAALDPHHGHTSGALSILHKEGKIARLVKKRGGCKVYVALGYEGGQETEPYGRLRPSLTDDELARFEYIRERYENPVSLGDVGSPDMGFLISLVERFA